MHPLEGGADLFAVALEAWGLGAVTLGPWCKVLGAMAVQPWGRSGGFRRTTAKSSEALAITVTA